MRPVPRAATGRASRGTIPGLDLPGRAKLVAVTKSIFECRAGRFPWQWLTNASAEDAVAYAKDMYNVRMSNMTGILRVGGAGTLADRVKSLESKVEVLGALRQEVRELRNRLEALEDGG